jgi:hypothetical protein
VEGGGEQAQQGGAGDTVKVTMSQAAGACAAYHGFTCAHLCLHSLALVLRPCPLLLLAETSWWRPTTVVPELPAGQGEDHPWVSVCSLHCAWIPLDHVQCMIAFQCVLPPYLFQCVCPPRVGLLQASCTVVNDMVVPKPGTWIVAIDF